MAIGTSCRRRLLGHASPFDANMAVDAGSHVVVPDTRVELKEVGPLLQYVIFSRGPKGVKRPAPSSAARMPSSSRHAGLRAQGDGAALPDLGLRRPRWLHHDRCRDGGEGGEGAAQKQGDWPAARS